MSGAEDRDIHIRGDRFEPERLAEVRAGEAITFRPVERRESTRVTVLLGGSPSPRLFGGSASFEVPRGEVVTRVVAAHEEDADYEIEAEREASEGEPPAPIKGNIKVVKTG